MFNCIKKSVNTELYRTRSLQLALGAVLGICLMFGMVQAGDAVRPACSYSLTSQIKAIAGEDGSLEILSSDLALPLVEGRLGSLVDSRRRRSKKQPLETFTALSREGVTGGQRGFSAQADDDGDGEVDEDRLDGQDNDGDGLVDEDYAAVSDAMTAVHISHGSGWAQLEFMQWAGTRLQNALFLNLSASHELSGAISPYYHLESGSTSWREVGVFSRRHSLAGQSLTGQATAFVLQVENPVSSSRLSAPSALSVPADSHFKWVGVLLLDSKTVMGNLRPQLEGGLLSLPLTEEPTAVVICTADSWMQLNRLLLDAVVVYQGVKDPVSQHQSRWIVSPLCSKCRLEKSVEFSAQEGPEGELSLHFALQPGRSGLMDPDLFVLSGIHLGPPNKITWHADDSIPVSTLWAMASMPTNPVYEDLPGDLYGMLGTVSEHSAKGVLIYDFLNPAAGAEGLLNSENGVELDGVWLDGRTFSAQGAVISSASTTETGAEEISDNTAESASARTQRGQYSLAPALLEGWPNPFRDQITIEFIIPSIMQDLFDWPEDEPLPDDVQLAGPVIWSSGQPSVSVKVYSINGQELISLQQGSLGEGRYSVSWNGTDAFGRQVASGTYFCKLQLDDWSVTRRLVFIR